MQPLTELCPLYYPHLMYTAKNMALVALTQSRNSEWMSLGVICMGSLMAESRIRKEIFRPVTASLVHGRVYTPVLYGPDFVPQCTRIYMLGPLRCSLILVNWPLHHLEFLIQAGLHSLEALSLSWDIHTSPMHITMSPESCSLLSPEP